ncbi:MAG: aldehyde dehydrogenase, partial [Bacteroidetes bacterium]
MDFLKDLGIDVNNQGASTGSNWIKSSGEKIDSFSPVDGKLIGSVIAADNASYEKIIHTAESAFKQWRLIPA